MRMKIIAWPRDTIAARFAWTVVLAVLLTLALVRLFFVFGGVWAHEPLDHSILRARASDVVRKGSIASSRLLAALRLVSRTDCYRLVLGRDLASAADAVESVLIRSA